MWQHLLFRRTASVVMTADDHGPVIAVATLFCGVVAMLSILIRLATRLGIRRMLSLDDFFAIIAMVRRRILFFAALHLFINPLNLSHLTYSWLVEPDLPRR